MSQFIEGKISVKKSDLDLDLTLLGGQSFRWEKVELSPLQWRGVAYGAYWILTQNEENIAYKVYPAVPNSQKQTYYNNLLQNYFRLDFDIDANIKKWTDAHEHFTQIGSNKKAVRVLAQEPFENILSFICSQNNNIKRISSMIQWLCCKYGKQIAIIDGRQEFTFPTLQQLTEHQNELDSSLREAKFGYRAKFISQTVAKINASGGEEWFEKLRKMPYTEARLELVQLPGIGFKVADCICLMSLNHLEAVPIDTHIFKIAQLAYMPQLAKVKSVTPKIYDEISLHFRNIYGTYAGWAQAILFCSELPQFQLKENKSKVPKVKSGNSIKRKCK